MNINFQVIGLTRLGIKPRVYSSRDRRSISLGHLSSIPLGRNDTPHVSRIGSFYFLILKFKFIDFEKIRFKFIDFEKTKFKIIEFEKMKLKFIDFEKTNFRFVKNL